MCSPGVQTGLFVLFEFPAIVDLVHGELILSIVRAGIRPWTSGRLGILLWHPVKVSVFEELLPEIFFCSSDQLRSLTGSIVFAVAKFGALRWPLGRPPFFNKFVFCDLGEVFIVVS